LGGPYTVKDAENRRKLVVNAEAKEKETGGPKGEFIKAENKGWNRGEGRQLSEIYNKMGRGNQGGPNVKKSGEVEKCHIKKATQSRQKGG